MTQPLRRSGMLVSTILRGCENKRRWPCEHVARVVGQQVVRDHGEKMYIYQCKLCRGWHLTHTKQSQSQLDVEHVFPAAPR